MTIAPEISTEITTSDGGVSPPQRPAMTSRGAEKFWARPAAFVVAVVVMWLIVLAIITLG